jgi:GNAT superfamily N-acetyltransferase
VSIEIKPYENWMREQVVRLFEAEYQIEAGEFDLLFGRFYEHPFQRENCIRIVAVDETKVAGFQSFFYWPVMQSGQLIKAYQSGNSLVHPEYRGKGLFGKMLNYIHLPESGFDCELLIGFPVPASYGSFIRNKWLNPFDLQWFVKPLNPVLSVFSEPEKALSKSLGERKQSDFSADSALTFVAQEAAFDQYRFSYETGDFYRFSFRSGGEEAFFELKAQRRKKVIRELIIGKFLTSRAERAFILEAFSALEKEVKRASSFTVLSIAVNPQSALLTEVLKNRGFRHINKKIHFIAKGRVADEVNDWADWWMFRADIDTW